MTPLISNYSNLAGKTVAWDTSDNEKIFLQNTQNNHTRQALDSLGFLNNPVEYTYNSHGFRTPEFDQKFDVVCFGCSFTMGTGVHSKDTWPSQLESLKGLKVANLGHAGSSNDTVFRYAQHYLPLLRPRYAVWLQTDIHRLELIDDTVGTNLNIIAGDTNNPCANDYFIKVWFSSEINQLLNLQKNTLAFRSLCDSLDIKHVLLPRDIISRPPFPYGCGRDLVHPGAETYKIIASQVANLIDS
jgi:lysophospholipase L1-like esterase